MEYVFTSGYYKEGGRAFIKIPFNVWDTCGRKGNIPVKAVIDNVTFECRLIPKGGGEYVLPVGKNIAARLSAGEEVAVRFTVLEQLTRITGGSPYSWENPIRHIGSIEFIRQPADGFCGQTCLAMLAGIPVDEVSKIMKSGAWQASISKVTETLDYFGFSHGRPVYTHGEKADFPKCCIVNMRGGEKSHLIVYFDGRFYDPASGIAEDCHYEDVISFIEVTDI